MVKPITPSPVPHPPRGTRPESAAKQTPDAAKPKGVEADLALDLGQMALDITGIFDPTPLSDGANALISLGRGDLLGAAISTVSIIPGIGDVAKLGKLGKYVETLGKIVDKVAGNPALKEGLEAAVGQIAKALDSIPPGMLDKLPAAARENIGKMRDAIGRFDRAPGQLLGAAHGNAPLAAERARRGLPAAGSPGDDSTVALLRFRGEDFLGVNRGIQQPKTDMKLDRVNAQTRTHAEADVVQQALNGTARKQGGQAEMWVDRDLCRSCGDNGGMRSLARNLGVDELIVHTPSGTRTFTPTK